MGRAWFLFLCISSLPHTPHGTQGVPGLCPRRGTLSRPAWHTVGLCASRVLGMVPPEALPRWASLGFCWPLEGSQPLALTSLVQCGVASGTCAHF